MKLLKKIPSESLRRRRQSSAQILAEACIGLSLLTLVWILLSFSTYMANNKIRAAMAARDAAWLQANGESISSVPGAFYFGGDVSLAKSPAGQKKSLSVIPGVPLWTGSAWSNSVSFGMTSGTFAGTTKYPFVLLKTHLPFMPTSSMDQFLSVNAGCAWPADVNNTYNKLSDALGLSGLSIPSF